MIETVQTVTDQVRPKQETGYGLTGQRKHLAVSQARRARDAMVAYESWAGAEAARRRREDILLLPRKLWHDRLVLRLYCHVCKKERWEAEYVAWYLISLQHYICPWCLTHG